VVVSVAKQRGWFRLEKWFSNLGKGLPFPTLSQLFLLIFTKIDIFYFFN
jgi:hypothetical protein